MKQYTIVMIFFSGLLIMPQLASASPTTIELKKEVSVGGAEFQLGDIAVINGDNDKIVNLLKTVDLGNTPSVTQGRRNVTVAEIMNKISEAGFTNDDVSFCGAPHTLVLPEMQTILPDVLLQRGEEYIRENMPWEENEALILPLRSPNPIDVSVGEVTFEVAPLSSDNFIGQTRYNVIVSVNGMVAKSVDVFFKITVFKKVLVAMQKIERGEMLTPDNVKLVKREVKASTQDAISKPELALGMIARRTIAEQKIIKEAYLSMPVLVQARNAVKMIVQSGPMTITSLGVAMENGSLGQFVRVQNIDSKKVVYGRVVGFRQVLLDGFDNQSNTGDEL